MAKPPAPRTAHAAPPATARGQQVQLVSRQGPLPEPQELHAYNELVPGSAERIIAMAEREQAARHNLEDMAQRADIRHRDELVQSQRANARGIFFSDALGQTLGFIIAAACVAGAIYTAVQGAPAAVSIAFLTLPVASVIKALRSRNDGPRK